MAEEGPEVSPSTYWPVVEPLASDACKKRKRLSLLSLQLSSCKAFSAGACLVTFQHGHKYGSG